MKLNKISTLFTIIFFILVAYIGNVQAETTITDQQNKDILSTSAMVTENYPPDTARIVLSVVTQAQTASEASIANRKKATNVVNKLNNLIDKKIGDNISTSSYSINPVYEYNNSKKKNELVGYKVSNQITIQTKQLNNVGSIIDSAIESGANQVQGIDFILSDNQNNCNDVLIKATQKAQTQANAIAQTLGVKVTGIKQVNASCNSESIVPQYRAMLGEAMMAKSSIAPTPISPENVRVSGNVNIDFYISK